MSLPNLPALAATARILSVAVLPGPIHFVDAAAQVQRGDTTIRMVTRAVHSGVATLVPEISIGQFDGADEYMFGEVNEIAVARDGSIYIFDRQVPALRKYDASGKFVKNFGRKGQGPGEYTTGGGLGILPDGRILLWDTGNWRINVYSPNGDVLTSWNTPGSLGPNSTYITSRALVVDTAGFIYLRQNVRDRQADGPQRQLGSRTVLVRFRPDGVVVDTIEAPAFARTPRSLTATLNTATGSSSTTAPVPFDPQPAWTISPHGYLITGIPDRYAFELLMPTRPADPRAPARWRPGQPILSIRRDVKPEPVSSAERKAARDRVEAMMRRTDPKWNWNGPDLPNVKPFYQNLIAAQDGRIWVPRVIESGRAGPGTTFSTSQSSVGGGSAGGSRAPSLQPRRTTGPAEPPRAGLYDVFEPNGTLIGQVQVPPRTQLLVRRGDHAWGIVFDQDDVATVKRFRIAWR